MWLHWQLTTSDNIFLFGIEQTQLNVATSRDRLMCRRNRGILNFMTLAALRTVEWSQKAAFVTKSVCYESNYSESKSKSRNYRQWIFFAIEVVFVWQIKRFAEWKANNSLSHFKQLCLLRCPETKLKLIYSRILFDKSFFFCVIAQNEQTLTREFEG